jgi:hypothetical protein
MSHRKNTSGQMGMPADEDAWKNQGAGAEWEADTNVMPPEYCRQLLEISKQLKQTR